MTSLLLASAITDALQRAHMFSPLLLSQHRTHVLTNSVHPWEAAQSWLHCDMPPHDRALSQYHALNSWRQRFASVVMLVAKFHSKLCTKMFTRKQCLTLSCLEAKSPVSQHVK